MIAGIVALLSGSGLKGTVEPYRGSFASIQGSLMAVSTPYYINPQVLATITEIMRRESGDRVFVKNPNSTAFGRCQIINSTWETFSYEWEERDDYEDQFNVCCRILESKNGIMHWEPYSGPYSYETNL